MTKEEAIKELQESLDTLREYDIAHSSRLKQALELAIKALSQEPCDVFDKYGNYKYPSDVVLTEPNTATSMPCDDAISRPTVVRFEGTNMACMGGDEIMKEFENNTQQHCNDRVISLERAKKQIGRWIGYIDQDMINRICISLEQLPSVTQKSGKWIPVSERVPQDHDWYLIVVKEKSTGYQYIPRVASYLHDNDWVIIDTEDANEEWLNDLVCVAWMPLPKPYEPQESEEISERNMKMWEEIFKAEREGKE